MLHHMQQVCRYSTQSFSELHAYRFHVPMARCGFVLCWPRKNILDAIEHVLDADLISSLEVVLGITAGAVPPSPHAMGGEGQP